MRTKKLTIQVTKWTDELVCPKCLRQDAEDETTYSAVRPLYIDGTNLCVVTCMVCGFNWLMETADA